MTSKSLTICEHLDELRSSLIKISIATVIFGAFAFMMKEELFGIVLAPKNDGFIKYSIFKSFSNLFSTQTEDTDIFVQLINTGLAEQFKIHIEVAMCIRSSVRILIRKRITGIITRERASFFFVHS